MIHPSSTVDLSAVTIAVPVAATFVGVAIGWAFRIGKANAKTDGAIKNLEERIEYHCETLDSISTKLEQCCEIIARLDERVAAINAKMRTKTR